MSFMDSDRQWKRQRDVMMYATEAVVDKDVQHDVRTSRLSQGRAVLLPRQATRLFRRVYGNMSFQACL